MEGNRILRSGDGTVRSVVERCDASRLFRLSVVVRLYPRLCL